MQTNMNMVIVCVTMQRSCQRLIQEGRHIADALDAGLAVVHVAKPGDNLLGNPDEGEALDTLFTAASEAGAQMQVLRSDKIAQSLAQFALENEATDIVVGQGRGRSQAVTSSILNEVERYLPNIRVHTATEKPRENSAYPLPSIRIEPET